jgi:hypothetical protein
MKQKTYAKKNVSTKKEKAGQNSWFSQSDEIKGR